MSFCARSFALTLLACFLVCPRAPVGNDVARNRAAAAAKEGFRQKNLLAAVMAVHLIGEGAPAVSSSFLERRRDRRVPAIPACLRPVLQSRPLPRRNP